jgi:2-haloacid dehalogenase
VPVNRRTFLAIGASSFLADAGASTSSGPTSKWSHIKGVAFDAFPVFDSRPILHACEEQFPGMGSELNAAWRTKQFEYQWLRALGGQYEDFWQTTQSALEYAARALKLELSSSARQRLMQGYLTLKAWPDVADVLAQLRRSGMKLALLSNVTPQMLEGGIRSAGLSELFDHVISTDRIRSFKPDPRAYQLGVDVLRLRKEEIMFVAFAGWDVAGAKWFGYPTFWNNRQNATSEQLGVSPDGNGQSLNELVAFLSDVRAQGASHEHG